MSTIKIHVTESEINYSEIGDPHSCMVANAFRRQLDLPDDATVNISITNDGNFLRGDGGVIPIKLNRSVQGKILAWDQGKNVNPFEFEVEFPDDWRKQLLGK